MKQELMHTKVFLKLILKEFERYRVNYWLDGGALLKYVRNGSIIPSSDLDIGVWQDQMDNILKVCENLRRKGFRIRFQRGFPFLEDEVRILIPKNYNTPFRFMDISLYTKLGKEAILRHIDNPCRNVKCGRFCRRLQIVLIRLSYRAQNSGQLGSHVFSQPFPLAAYIYAHLFKLVLRIYIFMCKTIWNVVPAHHFETLDDIDLYGMNMQIPSQVRNYLEYRYGENWINHDKKWRFADGKYVRFRRPSLLPKSKIIRRRVKSDVFNYKSTVKRGLYDFTSKEVIKINSLDY